MSEWMTEMLASKMRDIESWKKEALEYREALAKAEKALLQIRDLQAYNLHTETEKAIYVKAENSVAEIRRVLGGK